MLLLFPYTVLLRIHSIIRPEAYTLSDSDPMLTQWVFGLIESPLVQAIIGIILVYGQAVIINLLANNHRLHRTPTALAGMIYILMMSAIPSLQQLSPALIGASFILIGIYNIFKTYKLAAAAPNIFNAALAAGMATIIYPPYVLSILALFIGLAMMRNFKIVERFQFIIGFLTLLWIMGAFLFFLDLLDWSFFSVVNVPGSLHTLSFTDPNTLWNLGIAVILVLVSLLNYYNYMKKKGIDIRKKIDFFYWLMLCSLLALFLFRNLDYQLYFFVAISLSLFVSMAVLMVKNKALAELIHLCSLVGLFYYQFG